MIAFKTDLTNLRRKNSPQLLNQSKHKYISIFALSTNTFVLSRTDVLLMLLQQGKLQQQILHGISRSSRPGVFCKNVALKTYAKFKGKHLCWSLFLIKLWAFRPATLLKRDSNTGVFL